MPSHTTGCTSQRYKQLFEVDASDVSGVICNDTDIAFCDVREMMCAHFVAVKVQRSTGEVRCVYDYSQMSTKAAAQ